MRREAIYTTHEQSWPEQVPSRVRWFFVVWIAAVWVASLYMTLRRFANSSLIPEVVRVWLS